MKILIPFLLLVLVSCADNTEKKSAKSNKSYKFVTVDKNTFTERQNVYVPVYSNILHNNLTLPFELTATLSIRNTNFTDSIYITKVTYFNTLGVAIHQYIDKTILLEGMESIDFVVESTNKTGGLGANFVVEWGATHSTNHPLIQTVMISTEGQQGISFVCTGFDIE